MAFLHPESLMLSIESDHFDLLSGDFDVLTR
jgi:hypothetical protein